MLHEERLGETWKARALSEALEMQRSSNMEKKNTGMEAKVVCLPGPDLLNAAGFVKCLDPECCV